MRANETFAVKGGDNFKGQMECRKQKNTRPANKSKLTVKKRNKTLSSREGFSQLSGRAQEFVLKWCKALSSFFLPPCDPCLLYFEVLGPPMGTFLHERHIGLGVHLGLGSQQICEAAPPTSFPPNPPPQLPSSTQSPRSALLGSLSLLRP